MIIRPGTYTRPGSVFSVSPLVIWLSSLFIGVLASIPKILQLHITLTELMVDASIAFTYSLLIWYANLFSLPKFSNKAVDGSFFNIRLICSGVFGIVLMIVLVIAHQLLFPAYNFKSMLMMYQFRGILINLTIYMFLHLLYQSHRTQLMAIELERTRSDNLGAQFELLKQQVNPHFLFNSLSTLKSMIELGDPQSANFINKLSDFYRSTLENRKSDLITLSEELGILQAYFFLLKARFEEGISLDIRIHPSLYQSLIPPFTLQLLVENCVKHNVVSLVKPLHIMLYTTAENLVIENPLNLRKNPESSTQLGLENINQRYLHLLNQKIIIDNNNVLFTVKLPLIHEYPDH